MKRLNIIKRLATFGICAATCWLFNACRDFLYVEPTDTLTVNSYEDVRRLLGGNLLSYTQGQDYLQGAPNIFLGSKEYEVGFYYSDDYQVERYLDNPMGRNNQGEFMMSLDWRNSNIHESLWTLYYRNIGFYNIVLDELTKHSSGNTEQDQQVSGEARVLRAMCFFKLVQYFSPYHHNELGLPLNTDPSAVGSYDQRRKTQEENYGFIISELEDVLAYTARPSDTYNIFYNKTFINGLLAQIYLYKGDSGAKASDDYTKAAAHAQAVLDAGISSDTYSNIAQSGDSWGLNRNKSYAPLVFIYTEYSPQAAVAGLAIYNLYQYASDDLYQLYSATDRRKTAFFNSEQAFIKYSEPFTSLYSQYSLCTGAEMRLIVAEANARLGNTAAAKQALRTFATPRYTTYTEPTDAALLQSILDERRKEFCFEPYVRWLDLTRLQTAVTHNALDPDDPTKTNTLSNGDYRFCLPIPKNAELKDNNIAQNPGWGNF